MGPPVPAGGPIGWRDKSGCCLAASGKVARVSRVTKEVTVSRVRSIGDCRVCTALVRSVAWSFRSVAWSFRSVAWSLVWSFRSGLVRTAGDRITGRRFTGVGS
jgi:hypothetical protein